MEQFKFHEAAKLRVLLHFGRWKAEIMPDFESHHFSIPSYKKLRAPLPEAFIFVTACKGQLQTEDHFDSLYHHRGNTRVSDPVLAYLVDGILGA
jgi:hypothetical protein